MIIKNKENKDIIYSYSYIIKNNINFYSNSFNKINN